MLYPHPGSLLPAWQIVLSGFILAGGTVLVIVFRRKGYLPVGWFWFLGTLVPVIGLVQVGKAAMADRYAYLPLIGIFLMLAFGLDDWADSKRVPTMWRVTPAVGVVLSLAFVAARQIRYWESDYALWAHAVAVSGENPGAQKSLADALVDPDDAMSTNDLQAFDTEQKRLDAARQHFEEALKIYRRLAQENAAAYLGELAGVLNNLGNVARLQNRIDEAGRYFDEAFQIYVLLAQQNSDVYRPDLAITLTNLGSVATLQNRVSEAYDHEEAALNIYRQLAQEDPDNYQKGVVVALKNLAFLADTLNNAGSVAMQQNHLQEARTNYEEALRIERQLTGEGSGAAQIDRQLAQQNPAAYLPSVAATLNNLGLLEREQKQNAQAFSHFEEALKVYRQLAQQHPAEYLPETAIVLNNLGKLDVAQNRLDDASQNVEGALKIYRQLAQQFPDKYLPALAGTLNYIGFLDRLQMRLEQSRAYYTEAMTIYRKLAQGNSGRYANDTAKVEASLQELKALSR